uniref:NudC domain-containing protein 1 n=1 Tax=Globodera rostochiensis TaxID=31243 RepID=A0A914HZV7_GLORO
MANLSSSSEAADVLFTLRADQKLLDPTFDRYILRPERLAMSKKKIEGKKVRCKLPSASQWGYQQIRAHTLAAHLFFDRFGGSCRPSFFALLDDLRLVSLTFDQTSKCWSDPVEVAHIGTPPPSLSSPSCVGVDVEDASFPESLHFLDSHTALTSCGQNAFSVWYTGDRQKNPTTKWREMFKYEIPPLHKLHDDTKESAADEAYPALILDARRRQEEDTSGVVFDVLLLTVAPVEKAKSNGAESAEDDTAGGDKMEMARGKSSGGSVFRTNLIWVSVQAEQQQLINNEDDVSKFVVQRVRQILCDGKVEFACFDASVPRRLVVFGVGRSPRFVWDSAKPIISEAQQQQLQSPLVGGDGNETMDISAASDAEEPAKNRVQPAAAEDARQQFNADQLEECDRLPEVEDDVSAFWLDGDSHELVAMTIINELLFTAKITAGGAPVFATRYDVDTIVWRHNEIAAGKKESAVSHLFTLNAFGYIQAGHQDKRFLGCSPDGRYATLINRTNHCFLYFQSAAVPNEHELKNRRTGKRAEHIAKQLVLSMSDLDTDFDPNDALNEFIGFHAASDTLFLLTRSAIYAVEMPK